MAGPLPTETDVPKLAGVLTDLVTPFRDGHIDEDAFVGLIERQIGAGVRGVVVASGYAGERPTLRDGEARRLIELAVETVGRRVAVVADASSNSTASALPGVRQARDLGADAVLVAPPWYNRPSQEGVVRHYQEIAAVDALPILIWDCPARTLLPLTLPTMERLAGMAAIAGVVDATGDMARASALRRLGPDWTLLAGQDASALGHRAQGGDGWVSLVTNVAPQQVAAIDAACARQDWAAAQRMQESLADLAALLNLDPVPSAAKLALSMRGCCDAAVRLPITPCPDAVAAQVARAIEQVGASS
jgi:4-hydroxy-tetrahydrodipicolinate synthase